MSSITAISVTYNSAGVIKKSLAALQSCRLISNIIVVDNASSDGCATLLREQFPRVNLIENAENVGFGRGNNIALERVTTPYALLVNPDAIVSNEAIKELLAAAQRYPDAMIVAPQLADEDSKVHINYKRSVFDREKAAGVAQLPEGDVCADYLSGAVWLVNMAIAKRVGFFDPNIFLYYEDDDWCLRARKAGFSCVLAADAHVIHAKGGSSGAINPASEFFRQQQMIWSRLYIEQKYHGVEAARKLSRLLYSEYAIKAALYTLTFNRKKIARYRGRLAGVKAFSVSPAQAPAA